MRNKILYAIITISFIILGALQIHNTLTYPPKKGFDAEFHAEYMTYLVRERRVPLANEGWELYQAPLYYALAAPLPGPAWYRIIGLFTWGLLGWVSFKFFKRYLKDTAWALLSTLLVLSTPVIIYLTPAVGNEFFSSVVIGGALVYYLLTIKQRDRRSRILLGVLLGLALLSKATAFVLIAAIGIDQLISRKFRIVETIRELIVPFAVAGILGGWFYIRNLIVFRNPFATSVEFDPFKPSIAPYDRSLKFFLTPEAFMKADLFMAHHYSFLAGTYFSWFYDGHNVMTPVQAFSKAGLLLLAASVPLTVLAVVGFFSEARKITDHNRILLLYPVLLFVSYILYNLKIPFYGTVKGSFLVSAVIPLIYFMIMGVRRVKISAAVSAVYLLFFTLVVTRNFWINPLWYQHIKP